MQIGQIYLPPRFYDLPPSVPVKEPGMQTLYLHVEDIKLDPLPSPRWHWLLLAAGLALIIWRK